MYIFRIRAQYAAGRFLPAFLLGACVVEHPATGGPADWIEPTTFVLPLAEPSMFFQTVGVDHDPEEYPEGLLSGICTDYAGRGFPWCYDEHQGTDYLLEGGFETMDDGSVAVLAAAAGTVLATEDGHYDRCHTSGTSISCDGFEKEANYVTLDHHDGAATHYWHLKANSVAVEVGDQVECGDTLGLVGSSGNSSGPHLHFEVEPASGEWIDPYAGPYSQDTSLWVEQGEEWALPAAACPED